MLETYATLLKLTSVAGRYAVVLRFTSQVSFSDFTKPVKQLPTLDHSTRH